MATYKEIFGKQIKFLSSDPTNESEGQVWYNSTSGTFKSTLVSAAWSSASNMTTAQQNPGGFGIQTAAVSVGGNTPPNSNKTEEYNGSGWSAGGDYPQSLIGIGTAGTLTAGLAFGGRVPAGVTTCNEYDGSTWTGGGAYPTIISLACGVGPQTAALAATGDIAPTSPRYTDLCNDYNGTSWTAATSNTGTARYDAMAAGTATAAAICGGIDGGGGATEEYDGTNWTVGGANLFNVGAGGSSKNGTSDDWMVFGGDFPSNNLTAGYDGTSWAATPNLATARFGAGGAGTGTSGLCFAGREPGYSTLTEEFNKSTNVITAGAWASGGNMIAGTIVASGGFGTQTAAVATAGQIITTPPYYTNKTENYDGSSWTASGVYPASLGSVGSTGTQTAGLAFGGTDSYTHPTTTNEYDGSTWTGGGAYPVAYRLVCGVGPQTAAMGMSGDAWPAVPRYSKLCFDYNGASWTATTSLGTARYGSMAAGTQTAAAINGGTNPASGATEEFNGASWTTGGTNLYNTSAGGSSKSGASDDWMVFGGSFPSNDLVTGYDGTSWSTRPSLGTARYGTAGAGTGPAAIGFGGGPTSSAKTSTEEFTGTTSAVNYKTITTS